MKWCHVEEKYLAFLHTFEERIPITNSTNSDFKPIFITLFEKDDSIYVVEVTQAEEQHNLMEDTPDFQKIYDDKNDLVCVLYLNNMFPVPKSEIQYINDDYSNLQHAKP